MTSVGTVSIRSYLAAIALYDGRKSEQRGFLLHQLLRLIPGINQPQGWESLGERHVVSFAEAGFAH